MGRLDNEFVIGRQPCGYPRPLPNDINSIKLCRHHQYNIAKFVPHYTDKLFSFLAGFLGFIKE
jgi:hypothetical protein